MTTEIIKIGKRGTLVIPSNLRKKFGLNEGDFVIIVDHIDGILIKPAVTLPIEHYTSERKAEFILSCAIDAKDYEEAKKTVRKMGLDPDKIKHYNPITKKIT